jgi:hypothetical protein
VGHGLFGEKTDSGAGFGEEYMCLAHLVPGIEEVLKEH